MLSRYQRKTWVYSAILYFFSLFEKYFKASILSGVRETHLYSYNPLVIAAALGDLTEDLHVNLKLNAHK